VATNYPTSIDSPVDPVAGNPMTNPDHAGQHTNSNDAIVAVETALGTTGAFNFLKNANNLSDVANTSASLANIGGQTLFQADVKKYGAVGNGTTDDTTAIKAAISAAVAAGGGIVWLPSGAFKISSTITVNSPFVSIIGAGKAASILEPTAALNGSVAMIVQINPFGSLTAGSFEDFTIDGLNTTSAVGFQYGDTFQGRVDIAAQNFTGTNAIGVHFVNQTYYTEENFIRLYVNNNTIGALFENTTGSSAFGYNDIDIFIRTLAAGQVGIEVDTSAYIYNGKFRVRGNLTGAGTVGINGVLHTGSYGGFVAEDFDVAFESNTGTVPLQFGANFLFQGSGLVDTTQGGTNNSTAVYPGGIVFDGWWGVPGFNPATGIFVTGTGGVTQVGGVLALTNGTDTSATATPSAPTFVSGTALQLNTTQDTMLYVEVTTAASLEIQMGSTSSVGTTLLSTITAALGMETIRVPKGWYVKITGTIADLNINAVSC